VHGIAGEFGSHVSAAASSIFRGCCRPRTCSSTASLGMSGKPALDIDLHTLKPDAIVLDVVYAPLETPLPPQRVPRPSHRRRPGHAAASGRIRL
jgi:hypothetical protein